MATQLERARAGEVTPQILAVAQEEGLDPVVVHDRVARGTIVIPNNANRPHRVVGIGEGLRTKVNASIGTSSDIVKLGERSRLLDREMSKARRDMQWDRQFELGLFGTEARAIRDSRTPADQDTCTMCGSFCAAKNAGALFADCLSSGKR